jgi:hypothetical protein
MIGHGQVRKAYPRYKILAEGLVTPLPVSFAGRNASTPPVRGTIFGGTRSFMSGTGSFLHSRLTFWRRAALFSCAPFSFLPA